MTEVRSTTDVLAASARADKLRDRHRDYYVALATQAEAELRGPEQATWRRLIESEYDNLRLALEWSISRRESEEALALAGGIFSAWTVRGDIGQAREWLEKALALDEETATARRVTILARLSRIVSGASHERSFSLAQEALEVAKKSGDRRAIHTALLNLGGFSGPYSYLKELGGPQATRDLLEESLDIARELEDAHAIASSMSALSFWIRRDEDGRARAMADESLALYRKLGDRYTLGWRLYTDAWSVDPSEGDKLTEEALAIGRELEDDVLILCTIELIAWQRYFRGDHLGAVKVIEDAVEEYRRPGRKWPVPWHLAWMLEDLAQFEAETGRFDDAEAHAHESIAVHSRQRSVPRYYPLIQLAKVAAAKGELALATERCEQALADTRKLGRPRAIYQSLVTLARVALLAGDIDGARSAAEESLPDAKPQGVPSGLATLADACLATGDIEGARAHLERYLDFVRRAPWWPHEEPIGHIRLGRVALAASELETASALFGAALTKFVEMSHKPLAAWAIEAFGALEVARGELDRAARLFGAAEAVYEGAGSDVPWEYRAERERTRAAIKDGLTDEAFEEARAAGRALSLDEAVSFVMNER